MKSGTILILGGAGLVGHAIARLLQASRFPHFNPVVVDRREPKQRVEGVTYIIGSDANVFDAAYMQGLIKRHKPVGIVDSVNIASLASKSSDIISTIRDYVFGVLKPLAAQGIAIVDVGTVGTGGMGYNIPYTHNEATADGNIAEGLVRKIAAASTHGGFLDLLGRTPEHRVGRVVPRAMIGFEQPFHGQISVAHLGGVPQMASSTFLSLNNLQGLTFQVNAPYTGVGVRCGENGEFGGEETEAITAIGQMECVTAEAVASAVMDVLMRLLAKGGSFINRDVHPDPTSIAQRNRVLKQMLLLSQDTQSPSVAFGNLGPYLTTQLWELWVLSKLGFTPNTLAQGIPGDLMLQQHGAVASELSVLLPGLGVPVITDHLFCPARIGNATEASAAEVTEQLRRVDLRDNDRLWGVDLRDQRLQHWVQSAKLIRTASDVRSNLPLAWKKPIRPGAFWAAYMTATGHGRQDYSQGSQY